MRETSFDFEVGRLICGHVREILESEKFHGRRIRFREGNGWFSRTFSIAGDETDVSAVMRRLEYYKRCTETPNVEVQGRAGIIGTSAGTTGSTTRGQK